MAGKRKAIRPVDRFEIFKRDLFVCQYCGRTPPTVVLEIDHIIAVSEGGGNEAANLITACKECNVDKGARSLTAAPASLDLQIEEQRERARQIAEYDGLLRTLRQAEIEAVERIGCYWYATVCQEKESSWVFGAARVPSIKRFLGQLTETEILNAVDVALGRFPYATKDDDGTAWKYFCGVCWHWIRRRRGEEVQR